MTKTFFPRRRDRHCLVAVDRFGPCTDRGAGQDPATEAKAPETATEKKARTAISLECSKQADEKKLKGKERRNSVRNARRPRPTRRNNAPAPSLR
jgi:hypothetical protein